MIEAVFEELELKRRVLAEVEAVTRPDAIFASNTSTIPIRDIAAERRPAGAGAGHALLLAGREDAAARGHPDRGHQPRGHRHRGPVRPPDGQDGHRGGATSPGFWVNRILSPYLNEAGILLQEGVPIELIDRTMTAWGFPVGPVALLDEVGLDVAQKAAKVMHEAFGERMQPRETLGRMLAANRLGRKNGRGFYRYHDGPQGRRGRPVYPLLGVAPGEDGRRRTWSSGGWCTPC